MRLAHGVLEGVDTVAPVSEEGVPTDAEVPHLNQEYCRPRSSSLSLGLASTPPRMIVVMLLVRRSSYGP